MRAPLFALALAAAAALAGAQAKGPAPAAKTAPAADTAARPEGLAVAFNATVQVDEPEKASQVLVDRARALGGWFFLRTQEYLDLRIPTPKVDAFIDSLPALGLVLEKNLQTRNLDAERQELEARLRAKQATLADYYAMLKESGDSTIFTLQNVITTLQMDIEQTTHRLLKLEDETRLARVAVSFRFQNRQPPLTGGRSRFEWLNRLGIRNLMQRFDYADK